MHDIDKRILFAVICMRRRDGIYTLQARTQGAMEGNLRRRVEGKNDGREVHTVFSEFNAQL
jgi:hypothetical protein